MKHSLEFCQVIDGIKYTVVDKNHVDKVIDFYFDTMLRDEPATKSCDAWKVRLPGMVKQVEDMIEDGVSLMALDVNDSNRLVGIFINCTLERNNVPPKMIFEELLKDFTECHAGIMCIMDNLMYSGDLFKTRPDLNKIYEMFALGTHSDCRGRGLGTNLVKFSVEVAKLAKCDGITVLATNNFSRKIFVNLGMELIGTADWKECVFNGKRLFENTQSDSATAHFMKL